MGGLPLACHRVCWSPCRVPLALPVLASCATAGLSSSVERPLCLTLLDKLAVAPNARPFYAVIRPIVSTNPLTASTLFWNAACSVSLKRSSTIRSTPPAPKTTGTPT